MMRVIFHGDDFGLTTGINKGVIQAHSHGLLSSASIVANGEAFEDAVSLVKENKDLDIGIHLVLSDERPLLTTNQLSLITPEGPVFPTRQRVFFSSLARKIDYNQIKIEWNAQIEKCLNSGIYVSHIDGHQFVHLFPGLFQITLQLADRYAIPYVRTVVYDIISLEAGLKRILEWSLLKIWTRCFISSKLPQHIGTIPTVGFLQAGGKMKSETILSTCDRIMMQQFFPTIEIMLHPGVVDEHTEHKYYSWEYAWNKDLNLLQDTSLSKALNSRGIEITSYRELIKSKSSVGPKSSTDDIFGKNTVNKS